MLGIRGIEIHDIAKAMGRSKFEKIGCQISMRINDADAFAGLDVLDDQVFQKRCLTRPAFADRVEMLASVFSRKAKRLFTAPAFAHPYLYFFILHFESKPRSPPT